jgi:hypothetical protein
VSTAAALTEKRDHASRPALAMGLSFLLMGLGYACPVRLVPNAPAHMWQGELAPEILNLYALVAWMGQAHFLYAARGQFAALRNPRRRFLFGTILILALAALIFVRHLSGLALFSAIVWVYFIGHFAKSERLFEGTTEAQQGITRQPSGWHYQQTVVAFTWLSLVLFDVWKIDEHPWLLVGISLALAAALLALGGWKALAHGSSRFSILALFFIGECLVWGTYSRYMSPAFRVGVYVFHIAAASYFHYLGSYFFGHARKRDVFLNAVPVLAVNVVVIGLGYGASNWSALRWLHPLLGLEWFTVWVALHLMGSDIFPYLKRLHETSAR